MARKRLYERVLHLITAQQRAEINRLSAHFGISANKLVRWALDIGLSALSILSKLPIDIHASRGMMDTEPTDDGGNEDGNSQGS